MREREAERHVWGGKMEEANQNMPDWCSGRIMIWRTFQIAKNWGRLLWRATTSFWPENSLPASFTIPVTLFAPLSIENPSFLTRISSNFLSPLFTPRNKIQIDNGIWKWGWESASAELFYFFSRNSEALIKRDDENLSFERLILENCLSSSWTTRWLSPTQTMLLSSLATLLKDSSACLTLARAIYLIQNSPSSSWSSPPNPCAVLALGQFARPWFFALHPLHLWALSNLSHAHNPLLKRSQVTEALFGTLSNGSITNEMVEMLTFFASPLSKPTPLYLFS